MRTGACMSWNLLGKIMTPSALRVVLFTTQTLANEFFPLHKLFKGPVLAPVFENIATNVNSCL